MTGVDGFFAVLLWNEYSRTGNEKALETLMVMAYNMKLNETPFGERLRIDLPARPEIPFEPDLATIRKLKDRIAAPVTWS